MGDVVNLRRARKRRKRLEEDERAEANRFEHGISRSVRDRAGAETGKRDRALEAHRLDRGEGS